MIQQLVQQQNCLKKSFARRIGKSLTMSKKQALQQMLPKFIYAQEKLQLNTLQKIYLEIGPGMGEHFIRQLQLELDSLYIGAEVYLNGVAQILQQTDALQLSNYLIWPDDVCLLLQHIPNNCLSGVYILFPDPWPKRKQHQRRLLNQTRLNIIKTKLVVGGFISFASDITDYFDSILSLINLDAELLINSDDSLLPHRGYTATKYHQKAIAEGRIARFVTATLIS